MPKLVQKIYAAPQSGKTTAAASLVHGYTRLGIPAAYIAPTQLAAEGFAQRFGVPRENCFSWSEVGKFPLRVLSRYRAIVIDEAGAIDSKEGDPVDLLESAFATWIVPFPAVVGFYTALTKRRKGAGNASA